MNSRKVLKNALWAVSLLLASSAAALGQNGPAAGAATSASGGVFLPSLFETADRPPSPAACDDVALGPACPAGWTASAEFIILERIGTSNQTLVSTYPGVPDPTTQFIVGQGADQVHSSDLSQGFAGGPKLGLRRRGDGRCGLEASCFFIDGWNEAAGVPSAADVTPVFVAPGGFVQTTDSPSQIMHWAYATRLYNAEINARWELCPRVTVLAGLRWVGLWEDLAGTMSDPYRHSPFWETKTRNNLIGLQLGEQWKLFDRGRFSIDGLVKAGLFANIADEETGVSIYRIVHWESASTNHAAFLGEIGLRCTYQVTERLALTAGYQAMWLEGVATAPAQIPRTMSAAPSFFDVRVWSAGIDSTSGVFYHGATAGLEYSF